jgi:hypothetical protein
MKMAEVLIICKGIGNGLARFPIGPSLLEKTMNSQKAKKKAPGRLSRPGA